MKQIIQNYKSGELQLVEVPEPIQRPGGVLLSTQASLVSAGTEKLMIDFAKKGYIGKALERPDQVKMVINKIKVDGLFEAYKASMSRLDTPVPLGYSCSGAVIGAGEGAGDVKEGDRIACYSEPFASHAEYNFIPKNLFVRIPENVSYEEASFVGLGAIALNAIRIADLTFGENVAVIGLGLLGQLTVQLLKAFGCRVIGIDISPSKAKMAEKYGCDKTSVIGTDDVNQAVLDFTKGTGADAVIIMAGSKDNKPIELASEISRDQGRIVACGMISLDVPRQEFFKKELKVIVSRATGPGKFDPLYEKKGIDYPLPYVRWTTQRNMECFLDLVSNGRVKVLGLISHRFGIADALSAYEMILSGCEPYLGVVLQYPDTAKKETRKVLLPRKKENYVKGASLIGVGLIGAGLHAGTGILPALKKIKGIELVGIADANGFKSSHTGTKYGFKYCVSDYTELLKDPSINTVLIATRHNLHAKMASDALKAGKHVFLEKPLAMNMDELNLLSELYASHPGQLFMAGFNRRFAPTTRAAKKLLGDAGSMVINCRVSAGSVDKSSWVHDTGEGGGRVIGEVCHFVDLVQYLSGSLITKVYAENTSENGEDNLIISLKMENGTVATILYASQGDRLLPRERVEVFSKKSVCVIDNFKSFFFAKEGRSRKKKYFNLDRGFDGEFNAMFDAIRTGGGNPVDFNEYVNTTMVTFKVIESLRSGRPEEVKGL